MKFYVGLVFLALAAEMSLGMPNEAVEGIPTEGFDVNGFMEKFPNFHAQQLSSSQTAPTPPKHAYPHQVSIQTKKSGKWNHFCAGSILNERVVLTSARCGNTCEKSGCRLVAGAHNIRKNEDTQQIRNIKDIMIHPNFTNSKNDYDFGGFYTDTKFNFNHAVQPIELPSAGYPNGKCVASGWGKHDELKHANVTLIPHCDCEKIYGKKLTERMICAVCDYQDPVEYGGPLKCNGVLAGVGSWGYPICGTKQKPAVFGNVGKVLEESQNWIQNPETL